MSKVISAILLSLSVASCVKLEVKPENVVTDAVNTTKGAYDSYKLKKKGYVEQEYEHSIQWNKDQDEADAALQCLATVKKMAQKSSDKKIKIISQSTDATKDKTARTMHCKLKAYI